MIMNDLAKHKIIYDDTKFRTEERTMINTIFLLSYEKMGLRRVEDKTQIV